MKQRSLIPLALVAALTFACGDDVPLGTDPAPDPSSEYSLVLDLLPEDVVDVDLLFVVDNSLSMTEEQASLAEWAEDFLFGALELDEATRLNLHIAVVSSDTGAGPFNISGCSGRGDDGVFQSMPREAGCSGPTDSYIVDIDDGAGGRTRNYPGTLAETFGCIAKLGVEGCGFEQPLEAMKRALDGSNPENAGFLRDGALLAVVIVADEDDCSVFDEQMFDPAQNSIDDPLGPLSSFRCFEFGVVCDPDTPREPGLKTDCAPREDSPYVTPVADYVDFLQSLKPDPSMIVVGGIIGDASTDQTVAMNAEGNPEQTASCSSANGQAFAGIRLGAFLEAFPDRHKLASICSEDMRGPLADVAARIADTAGRAPCLRGTLSDMDASAAGMQASCRVSFRDASSAAQTVPHCSEAGPGATCFTLAPLAACSHTETQLSIAIEGNVPANAHTIVECVTR